MTWQEFKEAVEDQGVTKDTELGYIEWDNGHEPQFTSTADGQGYIE